MPLSSRIKEPHIAVVAITLGNVSSARVKESQLCTMCFPGSLGCNLNQDDTSTAASPKVTTIGKASSLSGLRNSAPFQASPQQSSAPAIGLSEPSLTLLTSTFDQAAPLSQPLLLSGLIQHLRILYRHNILLINLIHVLPFLHYHQFWR